MRKVLTGVAIFAAGCQASSDPLRDPLDSFWKEPAPAVSQVQFNTSAGSFVIELHREWAPTGVDRFYNLIRAGYYDDSRINRVRAGFIAQFGIPGDPEIAQIWRSVEIPDDPVESSNGRGTVAFAMTGPDTRTTQVYINYADNSRLDEQGFAPLGTVVSGMDVVDNWYSGYDETAGGGMRGGLQGPIFEGGNAFLDASYPRLDRIVTAVILENAS
jgi:cyclophilin family peptidyl-prolyl cis-trans isomerase